MIAVVLWVLSMCGAIVTMPVWPYSAKWQRYPACSCLGAAMVVALLVVVGVI